MNEVLSDNFLVDTKEILNNHSNLKSIVKPDISKNLPKFTIQQIFKDNWDDFLEFANIHNYEIRDVVLKNVEKIIHCKTPEMGYSFFECDKCNNYHISFHTCKSRFCSSCGRKYHEQRVLAIKSACLDVKHRHLVFTIPENIRYIFRKDRTLIHLLFEASAYTITSYFKSRNKSKNIKPGFVSILHSFGRGINFNPHIHILLTEGGVDKSGNFVNLNYFDYEYFRKTFMYRLLKLLSNHFGKGKFDSVLNELYKKYTNGFYVYAEEKKFSDFEKEISYIARYVGHPAIAQSRILKYDGENVTFCYNRHGDEKYIEETISVFEFMKLLIVHIPDEQFKTIRYYGIYRKKVTINEKVKKLINETTKKFHETMNKWKMMIISSFSYNPLICKNCLIEMKYCYSWFP